MIRGLPHLPPSPAWAWGPPPPPPQHGSKHHRLGGGRPKSMDRKGVQNKRCVPPAPPVGWVWWVGLRGVRGRGGAGIIYPFYVKKA